MGTLRFAHPIVTKATTRWMAVVDNVGTSHRESQRRCMAGGGLGAERNGWSVVKCCNLAALSV